MDTTETYIKMCEKAAEIQTLRPVNTDWDFGDYYTLVADQIHFGSPNYNIAGDNSSGEYGMPTHFQGQAWLPRQDQLQEMVVKPFDDLLPWFMSFFADVAGEFMLPGFLEIARSFEQLWLAFVMKERWGKIWTGEDWVKAE